VSPRSLPIHPDLVQLKLQAKELLREHRRGDQSAAARILGHQPRLRDRSLTEALNAPLTLADAQLVIAREYGFDKWSALKHHVEVASRWAEIKPHPRLRRRWPPSMPANSTVCGRLSRRILRSSGPGAISNRRSATSAPRRCCITWPAIPFALPSRRTWSRSPASSSPKVRT
jgi:hypothetical protein